MVQNVMKTNWGRVLLAVLGAFIYSLGVNLFLVPLGIFTGGLMGACQLLRSLILGLLGRGSITFDFAGLIFYAINIPIFILAWRTMGRLFFRNTLICASAYTLFVSIVPIPAAPLVEDVLTGCLLGGVISGVGTGLALTSGCCGGGLDVLGLYMSKKGVKMTMGQFNLGFNAVLFLLSGVLFDVPTMIYSVLNTIFHTMAIDRAHRQSVTVQVLIFTKQESPELTAFIMENLHRGLTRWEEGGLYRRGHPHFLRVHE